MVAYLEYSPPEIEEFMVIGDVVTNTVTVTNSGTIPLDFNVNIGDYGEPSLLRLVPRGISIPASDGNFPRGAAAPSFGAPPALKESSTPASAGQLRVPDGTSAYATDAGLAQVVQFDLDVPATLNSLAPFAQFVWAGDFAGGDFSKTYALRDDNTLVTFDSLTGAATIIGVVPPPPGGETYTGMAYDASTGTMYASSCNITTSSLFTVDLGAPSTTLVGAITNSPCTIGIAVDDGGQMYGFDLVNDSLMSIDKATGAGTIIGSLGFDANFGQGMDWDSATGQLYLAAFNNGTFQAELRIADTTTGNTALVGALGTPGTSQLGWVAIAAGGSSSNWVYAVPDSGTVPAGGSTTFDVVFDATSLIRVGDYTAELSFSGNFDNMVPAMPLTMHLSCPTCGFLNGSITDANTTDPLVADVLIDGPGAFLLDLRADSYNIAVQPGTYDFTVSANGYLTETASVIVTQGVTVTTDFALVPAEAVLAYSPDRIEEWVTRGDAVTNTMLITNTGSIPLDFVLVDVETGNPAMPLIVRRAPAVTCPADIFGYTCTNSTEPDGLVAYNFEDISGTGTAVFLSDDEVSGPVPLGFDFNYYGADYPEIYISSNGFLTVLPGQSSGCCTGQPIPTAGSPDGVIAGWWDDLNPSSGGTIHYQVLGTAPFQYLVVQFTGVPHFGGGNEVTMQYKLFEGSNNIEVHYMAAPPDGTDHSAGIENDTGTDGVQYYFGGAGLGPDLAVCYLYPGQFACGSGGVDAAWAIESPDLGMILAGETLAVDVGFHSEVVTQTGTYTANLLFAGNYVNAVSPATLVMHVSDAGVQIGPDHSGSGAHGSQVVYDFTVMNTGWVTDTYSLSATHGTFTATLSTTTTGPLGPGESMDMTLTVDIPDDALFGEFDIATITATSTWDVNMSDSATATTTVVEYLYYFSFVPKN